MLRWAVGALTLVALVALVVLLVGWLNVRGDTDLADPSGAIAITPRLVERGAYLARAGDCAACHTQPGGSAYAGGRGIETPFGTVYSSNLTPDAGSGIGAWSAGEFWRAMHNGRSRGGRLLYPAFPYPNFTQVTREDSDAIYAFLRSQPPAAQANRANTLRFPYDSQAALAVWRALFFRAGVFEPEADKSAAWNRGAYLTRGLGHCVACHSTRNAFGATSGGLELGGGPIPLQNWYAPSLASASEAGVAGWASDDVVGLLKTGTSPHGSVLGPMAEVVFRGTQHLADADLQAMAVFLKELPQAAAAVPPGDRPDTAAMARGAAVYKDRCADCHGAEGQGAAGAYPPLAGSRKVTMASPTNVVRVIVDGGFAPATQGNPRPYGMPPFFQVLNNAQIADVVTYVRNAWGNQATPLSELDVMRARQSR
jgi:mono/diheme cytochrome c family protein